ncbi:MAG: DUF72 domain-containing protein [Rubrivivax sp.]|nr:DUF72 domain-containing protein [Rubrivivax sp.]
MPSPAPLLLLAGASGYAYDQWRGNFHPEKLRAGEMLGRYTQHLGKVEINNTFYRMPRRSVLERWAPRCPNTSALRSRPRAASRTRHGSMARRAGWPRPVGATRACGSSIAPRPAWPSGPRALQRRRGARPTCTSCTSPRRCRACTRLAWRQPEHASAGSGTAGNAQGRPGVPDMKAEPSASVRPAGGC